MKTSWLGGFKTIIIHTTMYVNFLNLALIAITAYNTSLRSEILSFMPWFKVWHFLLFGLVVLGLAMFLEYKLIYPSYIRFQNQQEYEHQNRLKGDLDRIEAKLDEILKRER